MHRVRVSAAAGIAGVLAALLLWLAVATLAGGRARAGVTPGPWHWPLDPLPRVVRGFEAPAGPFAAGHRGVDLAARVGQQVRSAGTGTVAFAGMVAGRGVVSVDHPDGRRTTYEPVTAVLRAGDEVAPGAVLGAVSSAPGHCLPGTCLHWGLRVGDTYLDPLRLVGAVAVRLLPVWTGQRSPPVSAPPSAGAPTEVVPAVAGSTDRGPLLAGVRGWE